MMGTVRSQPDRVWTWALAVGAALMATTVAGAAGSIIATAADGYTSVDFLPADQVKSFCLFGDDMAIFTNTNGLQIVDRENPASRQSWGKPDEYLDYYASAGVWPSFLTADPTGQSLWVGFTISNNSDDRIYQVDASGTWTQRATLTGNFDMEFHAGNAYVSANPGAAGSSGTKDNSLYLFDTTGAGEHQVLAEVGGSSVGLALDSSGNVYCGTHNGDGSDNQIVRFSAAQIASAIGSDPLTLAAGEELFTLSASPYDLDIDDAGHLVFDARSFSGSNYVAVWDEDDGGQITQLATSIVASSAFRFTLVSTIGDVTASGGTIFANNVIQKGIAEIVKLIPGDADGDGTVGTADAAIMAEHWGEATGMDWADGDFNADGSVNAVDAAMLAANWGQSLWATSEATAAPEPGGLALLFAAVMVAIVGTRRGATRW